MMFLHRKPDTKSARLMKKIADLESQLEARDRVIAVLEAERDSMAAVIARDRMRVASECAIAARTKAEAEGNTDDRTTESNHRVRAIVSGS